MSDIPVTAITLAPIPPGLLLLRSPFPKNQVGKLAKGSKAQSQCAPAEKQNCSVCGGWHHPKMIHLDYVGHAALTDRLLDADPGWFWEPLALKDGLPSFDADGGLWIKLTVSGVTRLGYGNAAESEYKEIGSRQKEVIGDALRNAAMRFGAALELWHKGDLHAEEEKKEEKKFPSGHDLVDGDKTVGQIVDQNLAMAEIEDPAARKSINDTAKAIETEFYTKSAKTAVERWRKARTGMSESEANALWGAMQATVRNNLRKCEDAMGAEA